MSSATPPTYTLTGTITVALTFAPVLTIEPVRTSSGTIVVTSSATTVTVE